MTLVEMMVATGLSSILLLVLCSLTLYSARSFNSMVNYTDLNRDSRRALDRMSKEIRQSRGLIKYTPTSLVFKLDSGEVCYEYDPINKKITENKGDGPKDVLKNCISWTNQIFQRNPKEGNFDFYPTTIAADCKMVQITWVCASAAAMGQSNTVDVQSMKVVIRKKPD